jgi:hypothetical protein
VTDSSGLVEVIKQGGSPATAIQHETARPPANPRGSGKRAQVGARPRGWGKWAQVGARPRGVSALRGKSGVSAMTR